MSLETLLSYRILQVDSLQITGYKVVLVILIVLLGRVTLFLIKKALLRRTEDSVWDRARRMSIYLLCRYIIWVVVILLVLQTLGIQLTLLLAGSAALLVGLGLGIQQIFNDIVSGIFLLVEGTIKLDDVLEVDGLVCKVKEISLRTSKVETRDDIILIIPNHKFINDNVINWSRQPSMHARFHVAVGVSYNSDPERVRQVLVDSMLAQSDILVEDPWQPTVRFTGFGDSALEFEMLFWSTQTFRIENIKSELRFDVFRRLKEAGIEIPFPQRDLHIKSMPSAEHGSSRAPSGI
ncbi:MAG: mechanosensitive ion channel [Calditrichaeota bacterium]|nr:mechanosensitive ion channel [Candidatus Cloacimonadota bacterium]MCA9787081.1 mechanosensitive ion channel [Candidatus Cloacimonadota bacterium]MCB1048526.1 mechanosensitive ion channel [Calditrichota bacterium]MCB9474577.1 mechanosensitive ion channel [Candidatus Delongbacteria bacterium]